MRKEKDTKTIIIKKFEIIQKYIFKYISLLN